MAVSSNAVPVHQILIDLPRDAVSPKNVTFAIPVVVYEHFPPTRDQSIVELKPLHAVHYVGAISTGDGRASGCPGDRVGTAGSSEHRCVLPQAACERIVASITN